MHTQSSTRSHQISESPEQAIRRLAFAALNHGIRVYQYPHTGEFFTSSYSQPDILHRVTRLSCDCRGFVQHGRCGHHAALLHHLGELPEPTPPTAHRSPTDRGPVVLCDQCGEPMRHINGASFQCACGEAFAVDWQTADEIDRQLCDLSQHNCDCYAWIENMLSEGGDSVPAGGDPDEFPYREDVCSALGRYNVSANEVAAVLIWRADLGEVSDRLAA